MFPQDHAAGCRVRAINSATGLAGAFVLLFLLSYPAFADEDSNEAKLGDRLFLETRFAQYFYAHSDGDVNAPLEHGDPVMEKSLTITGQVLPGAFTGQSINCRACHLVNEYCKTPGIRSYADFARRSPVPGREDGQTTTVRNSPALVTAARKSNAGLVLHLDGEFPSMTELVKGTFTRRNPYLHNGSKDQLGDVLSFYIRFSALARKEMVRSADANLAKIHLDASDIPPLLAFLSSLNEDYDD